MLKRPDTWETWPVEIQQLWDQAADILGGGKGAGISGPVATLAELGSSGPCAMAASALAAIEELSVQVTPGLLLRNLECVVVGLADRLDELVVVAERLREGYTVQRRTLMTECMRAPRAKA